MSIKDNLSQTPLQTLGGFSILVMEGLDAEAFAQAQFMNDVRALEPGQWQWNGWLNPKGRVIVLFALLQVAPGLLWLILPDVDAVDLASKLQRFVFRAKVKLQASSDRIVAAQWPGADGGPPGGDRMQGDIDSGLALDWGHPGEPRRLWVLPKSAPAPVAADADGDARWRAYDLAHGWPRLPATQSEAWTPQMLSLERLAAFSIKKGCYPGQEIVARTHFLGQAKRALIRIAGSGLSTGDTVSSAGQAVGTVVCARADGTEALAVASLSKDSPFDNPQITLLSLQEGLRRPR